MISEPFVISTKRSEWRNLRLNGCGERSLDYGLRPLLELKGEWDIEIND